MEKSTEVLADDIKFYEDESMVAKNKQKSTLVELAVKIMSVSVATIQLIHMIVINVSREHDKKVVRD